MSEQLKQLQAVQTLKQMNLLMEGFSVFDQKPSATQDLQGFKTALESLSPQEVEVLIKKAYVADAQTLKALGELAEWETVDAAAQEDLRTRHTRLDHLLKMLKPRLLPNAGEGMARHLRVKALHELENDIHQHFYLAYQARQTLLMALKTRLTLEILPLFTAKIAKLRGALPPSQSLPSDADATLTEVSERAMTACEFDLMVGTKESKKDGSSLHGLLGYLDDEIDSLAIDESEATVAPEAVADPRMEAIEAKQRVKKPFSILAPKETTQALHALGDALSHTISELKAQRKAYAKQRGLFDSVIKMLRDCLKRFGFYQGTLTKATVNLHRIFQAVPVKQVEKAADVDEGLRPPV